MSHNVYRALQVSFASWVQLSEIVLLDMFVVLGMLFLVLHLMLESTFKGENVPQVSIVLPERLSHFLA